MKIEASSRRLLNRKHLLFAAVALATPGMAFGQAVNATPQTVEPQTDEQTVGGGNYIVVTARKVNETVQDVPIAITALSGTALTDRNVASLEQLSAFVPSFQFDSGAAIAASTFTTTAFIRGVGQNDYAVFTDPGVGLYVDEVYLARSIGAGLDNFEIERVEVLRGPQGTLFGRNTIGGAINVVTKQPGKEFGGYVRGATGRFNEINLEGAIDLPLSEQIQSRFAVGYFKHDGYARLLSDNLDQGDKDNLLLRGVIRATPTEKLTFTLSGDYTKGKSNGSPVTLGGVQPTGLFIQLFNQLVAPRAGITAPNGLPTYNASFVTNDPLTSNGTGPTQNRLTTYGTSFNAALDLGSVILRSITAYRYLEALFGRDGDASPFSFRETRQFETSKTFSQEFQATGRLFDGRLNYLAGAYYFNEDGFDKVDLILTNGLFQALEALPGPLPNGFGGKSNPRNVVVDNVLLDTNVVKSRTYALFGNVTFDVTDWLTLEGGVRQNWDRKQFLPVHLRVASGAYIAPPGSRFAARWQSFTPRFGVRVKAARDLNFYATYSKGFKSGGFNARPLTSIAEINQYEPESVASYEVGMKSQLFDRHVTLNLAAFTSDYTNIQLPVNQPPANFVFNAGSGRIRGIEAESAAKFGGFTANVSVGYLDAKYTSIGQNIGPGQFIPITLASKFIKAPEWTWAVGGQYSLPTSVGTLSLRSDYSFKSSFYNDVGNSPQIFQPGFGLLSARLAFKLNDNKTTFALSGTNLADKRFLIAGNVAGAALGSLVERTYGAPREWEFSVRHEF